MSIIAKTSREPNKTGDPHKKGRFDIIDLMQCIQDEKDKKTEAEKTKGEK